MKPIESVMELAEIYRESCVKHNTTPIESIVKHLGTVDLGKPSRLPILNLREQNLTAESCEALEEVFKRVSSFVILFRFHDCRFQDNVSTKRFLIFV